jgi:hypothetical protein
LEPSHFASSVVTPRCYKVGEVALVPPTSSRMISTIPLPPSLWLKSKKKIEE